MFKSILTALNPQELQPFRRRMQMIFPDPELEAKRQRILLTGEIPSPLNPPMGCRFCSRCPSVMEKCWLEEPLLKDMGLNHSVACHLIKD